MKRYKAMRKALMLLSIGCALSFAVACSGGDDAPAAPSAEDRMRIMEQQLENINQYIASEAQAQATAAANPAPEGLRVVAPNSQAQTAPFTGSGNPPPMYAAEPTYVLKREDASDNEKRIVRFLADCSKRRYLSVDLPKEVIEWEVEQAENGMWEALEAGQYISFEQFIGMGFQFCQPEIEEE